MRWSLIHTFCLLSALGTQQVLSFQVRSSFRLQSNAFSIPPSTARKAVSSIDESIEDDLGEVVAADTSKAELKFVAQIATRSSALSYNSKDEVISFFQCTQNRNMFITAGGKRECQMISVSPKILEDWTKLCEQEGTAVPQETDEVFTVKTGGVQFPGLTLETSAIMGIKLIDEYTGPRYEVTMIGDERKVRGLPPMVYIFNKLTGGGSGNGSSSNFSTTHIICEFSESERQVVFRTDTTLTINVKFPAILMKILPANKEKMEEQGSQAITKAVAKDVEASMVAYEEAFLRSFREFQR